MNTVELSRVVVPLTFDTKQHFGKNFTLDELDLQLIKPPTDILAHVMPIKVYFNQHFA